MDPDEKKKMEECEKKDEEKKEELKKFDEEMADGGFSRLWPYQIPGWVIPIAALGSAVSGACMPVFGVIFSKIMNELTIKLTSQEVKDKVKKNMEFYVVMLVVLGIANFLGMAVAKYCYGILGENVTFEVRKLLYTKILR